MNNKTTWVSVDKLQTLIDIVNGDVDIEEIDIKVVNPVSFSDEDSYIESLGSIEISTIPYLLREDNLLFLKEAVIEVEEENDDTTNI